MADEALPAGYLEAGRDYLAALNGLGLYPEFFGWGQQPATKKWLIVMVTSALEIAGPLALSEILFKAYNANATPKQISPFIVRAFGRSSLPAQRFIDTGNFIPSTGYIVGQPDNKVKSVAFEVGDLKVFSETSYRVQNRTLKGKLRTKRQNEFEWERFKERVERLAA